MPASGFRTVLNGTKLRNRRRRAQRATLAAVAVLAFLLGGVAAGLVGYVSAVSGAAVRDTFDDVPPTERVFQLSARVTDDAAAQDDTAIAAFDRFVGDAEYDLHRSLLTEPRQLLDPAAPQAEGADAGLPRIALAAYETLAEHAELVAGEWPSETSDDDRVPVALHEDAASALEIEIGDELAFEERRQLAELVVVGTWRPSDPDADYWYASPLETTGMAGGDGLAVLAEQDLLDLPGPVPVARWRLIPDVDRATLADLSELRRGLPSIRPYLADDPFFSGAGIAVADDLIAGLEGTDSALLAARSVAIAPLLLAVISAIGAIGLMSRLLSESRLAETLLLRGRGWSRTQATGWALGESARVFALPAVLGGAVGLGALRVARPDLDVPLPAVGVGIGVVVVAGLGTLIIVAVRAAGPAHVTVEQRATASRRQVVGRAGTLILVFAVAALATWQLRRYGGVTVLDAEGIRQLDPVAVAAPAAILLAAAVVVAGLIMLVGRVAERVLEGRSGLVAVHAARVLARQPAGYVLPVVLIGLAAASGTFAASYTSTWRDLQGEVAKERTAADVEVELDAARVLTTTIEPLALAYYEDIGGVRNAVAAMNRSAQLGDGEITVVAAGGDGAAIGIELPAGESTAEIEIASELELFSEETGEAEALTHDGEPVEVTGNVRAWLVDADGSGGVVDTGSITLATSSPDSAVVEFDLPPDTGEPWRIVAVDVRLELPVVQDIETDFALSIAEVRAGDGAVPVPNEGWSATTVATPDLTHYSVSSTGAAEAGLTGTLPPDDFFGMNPDLTARLVHGAGLVSATATDATLGAFGLAVGDEAGLDVLGGQIPIIVDGRAQSVPGAALPAALSVDLHSLIAAVLHSGGQPPAPDRVWLTTDPAADQGAIADAAAGIAGPDSVVSSRAVVEADLMGSRLAQLVVRTFWLVAAVTAGLAVVGAWAGTASSLTSRRAEVGVFRALGFSAVQQGRQRRREMLLLGLLATALGAAAGYVAGWIAVPALAGSATPGLPGSVEPVVAIDWPWLATFVAALALLLTAIVIGYGARVRRQAAATLGVEVTV